MAFRGGEEVSTDVPFGVKLSSNHEAILVCLEEA